MQAVEGGLRIGDWRERGLLIDVECNKGLIITPGPLLIYYIGRFPLKILCCRLQRREERRQGSGLLLIDLRGGWHY